MNDILASLLILASNFSQYEPVSSSPILTPQSHQQLITTLCQGKECNALAYYDDKSQTIFYDERLKASSTIAQGFIVHELVHFLQHQHSVVPDNASCEERISLEREAYQVQQRFLHSRHMNTIEITMAVKMLSNACQ
ncbi:MAG TPA: hypothetical protein ENI26_02860 [Methylophaga aminisulfidivorans]|uniref:Uncharacterized protein n=2 Tax=root TaxID=1 RepID=A0A7C2AN79_9GAMM|nr:hypothetical protein [Methylophaga aminisulfidivorans]HEC73294.1 hypothetical protein [Methylophaga aminisulfidivorans]